MIPASPQGTAANTSGERRRVHKTAPTKSKLGSEPSAGRYHRAPPERVIDDRYAVGRMIGEGGMGKVYRCRHLRLRSKLAIKILRRQFAFDDELTERFLNEAAATSAIDSVNVVQMRDCGVLRDGRPYLVMDFLEGDSLYDRLGRSPALDPSEAVEIFRQICCGLRAAHAAGVIHRDLKPENIHLCPSETGHTVVKLLDFGIAKIVDAAGSVTRAGTLFGTPQYMSPEQSRGMAVDARSDIYAAGVLLYEMLACRLPFDGETTSEIITKHRYQPPTPLRQLRGVSERVPVQLDRLVLRCLAKSPDDRFNNVSELLEELNQTQQQAVLPKHLLRPPLRRTIGVRPETTCYPS